MSILGMETPCRGSIPRATRGWKTRGADSKIEENRWGRNEAKEPVRAGMSYR